MAEDMGIYTHNFDKNMTAALLTCSSQHANGTLPYYQCLCSGLQNKRFIRVKYHYCRRAAEAEEEASAEARAEIAQIVGIVLGVLAFLLILILIYAKFKVQIRARLADCGLVKSLGSCTRKICCCCGNSKRRRGGQDPDDHRSSEPTSICGRCWNSDLVLGCMELMCDCDCFETRRTPKYLLPILVKSRKSSNNDSNTEEPMVETHQPRRMRSVRRAPPPPMPDAPNFSPEKRMGSKRRAPRPPVPSAPMETKPEQHRPQYQPAHHSGYQHPPRTPQHQPEPQAQYQPSSAADQPPQYQDLEHRAAQFQRGAPPRVSKEFTDRLNATMMERLMPAESDL